MGCGLEGPAAVRHTGPVAHESIELDSRLTTEKIGEIFRTSIAESTVKARFGRIDIDPERATKLNEFAGYAVGRTITSRWCVQIYIRDDGGSRHVELAILGSSPIAKVWEGTTRTHSLSHGRLKAVAVINALKVAETA